MYPFETMCDDSPRGSYGPDVYIQVKLTHEDCMELGRWFTDEDPYDMDYDEWGDYYERVRNKLVYEYRYTEEESWEFRIAWSNKLKYDCKKYYKEHLEL